MKPEEKARQNIDRLLTKASWAIQDRKQMNLGESLGVAVRTLCPPDLQTTCYSSIGER